MKRNTAFLLALLAIDSAALAAPTPADADSPERGEKIRYQLILPEEKAPEVVKPNEPNPFAKADNHVLKEDGASGEENRVREILSNLPVTGFAEGGTEGPRVMVGPYKLKRNDMVPQVLAEQSVRLRVNSISKTQIDLIWVEKKNKNTGLAPRVVTLPVHITPKVRIETPKPITPETKGGGGTFFQYSASNSGSAGDVPSPPETRKAFAVETEKTPPPPAKPTDEHPANMIMNYLFKSINKQVDTQPKIDTTPQPK